MQYVASVANRGANRVAGRIKLYTELPSVNRPNRPGIPGLEDLEFLNEDIAQILENVGELDRKLDATIELFKLPI
jgi:hypothetical protein